MIKEFIEKWEQEKEKLYQKFLLNAPDSYCDIVKEIILLINPKNKDGLPDPTKIVCLEGGSYQGTNLYVIRDHDEYRARFWYIFVDYGSCSGCDTMQQIEYSTDSREQKAKDYLTLAMHILQSIKYIKND